MSIQIKNSYKIFKSKKIAYFYLLGYTVCILYNYYLMLDSYNSLKENEKKSWNPNVDQLFFTLNVDNDFDKSIKPYIELLKTADYKKAKKDLNFSWKYFESNEGTEGIDYFYSKLHGDDFLFAVKDPDPEDINESRVSQIKNDLDKAIDKIGNNNIIDVLSLYQENANKKNSLLGVKYDKETLFEAILDENISNEKKKEYLTKLMDCLLYSMPWYLHPPQYLETAHFFISSLIQQLKEQNVYYFHLMIQYSRIHF